MNSPSPRLRGMVRSFERRIHHAPTSGEFSGAMVFIGAQFIAPGSSLFLRRVDQVDQDDAVRRGAGANPLGDLVGGKIYHKDLLAVSPCDP